MSETPTKPGTTYRVTHEDARRAYTILATGANGFIEALQDFADRRFPASPWRSASEPPVVPEGDDVIEVFALYECEDGTPLPSVELFSSRLGWLTSNPPVVWMYIPEYKKPIPPHAETEKGAEE